ncbi:hypothetical protein [Micromonospora sp. NPDC005652]|uniref:hypothetical protein n=1 Tax=Micromonospora sp. NPDC005652 TaxID=3157046 RepID=UPI0033F9203A
MVTQPRQQERRARRRLSALAATLLTAALVTAAAPASASGPEIPGGFASWEALFDAQQVRTDAVEAIRAAADAAGDTGYSVGEADPTAPAVVLRWKGTPAPATAAAITAQRSRIPITVVPATYNAAELDAAAAKVARGTGDALYAVVPKVDGSGLTVEFNPGRTSTEIAASARTMAGMPVTVAGEESPTGPVLLSRQNDTTPYKGGARTNACTTGFGVSVPGSSRMLYAAHCGVSGQTVYDAAGDAMGALTDRNQATDIATIAVSTSGHVWDGGPQSTYFKGVKAAAPALVGNFICTSGSRSGAVCGGKINAVGVYNGSIGPLARFLNTNSAPMIGQGDSGGPAFATRSDGGVTAQGVISSGWSSYQTSTCAGETGRTCYRGGHIIDVKQILSRIGGTIRTG